MAGLSITSANSVYMISVPGVFSAAQQLQQFGVDEAFDTEAADVAVTQVGVDGEGVAGYVPREVPQTITFLASSPSINIFEGWAAAMDGAFDVIYATATILLPSIQRIYTCQRGILTRYPALPNARRTLAQRQFRVMWLPTGGVPAITSAAAL